jgi:hypothetical protein
VSWPSAWADGRTVRLRLIPAASGVFVAGLVISAALYYPGKPLDLRRAVISNLARPTDNPRGYLFAGIGMALCGLLLVPAALWFFRVLRRLGGGVAAAGLGLFGSGLAGAIFIGVMSPFEDAYSDVHIYVAYATFVLIAAGMLVWLTMATFAAQRAGRGRGLVAALALQACVMAFLLYLTVSMILPFGPDFFNEKSFLRSGAFCEWVLCGGNVAYLFILAAAVALVEGLPVTAPDARAQSR